MKVKSLVEHMKEVKRLYEENEKSVSILDIIEDYIESVDNIIDMDDLMLVVREQSVWRDWIRTELESFNIKNRYDENIEVPNTSLF